MTLSARSLSEPRRTVTAGLQSTKSAQKVSQCGYAFLRAINVDFMSGTINKYKLGLRQSRCNVLLFIDRRGSAAGGR